MAHPVGRLTQAAAGRGMTGKRYAAFGGKGGQHVRPQRISVMGGGRRLVAVGGGR
jgi:hypothetical protein